MNLNLDGQTIDAITLDFAVTIRTSGGAEFRIGTGMTIRGSEGSMVWLQAEAVGPASVALVGLLHRTISSAEVDEDGTLRLTLDSEVQVEVHPGRKFEAWTFDGAAGEKLVALPGGGLAVWDA